MQKLSLSPAAISRAIQHNMAINENTGKSLQDAKRGKATIVRAYEDALHVHFYHAMPLLDSHGLKATLYVSGYTPALQTRLQQWRAAAMIGPEIGNHTLFHPCTCRKPGREFV